MRKSLFFSVTNDLRQDQRMIRICSSLQQHGYAVTLIGRSERKSSPLTDRAYRQIRIACRFSKGKLMYLEYNLRLLFFLLTHSRADAYVAIDLDTIIPIYLASVIRRSGRLYDAHEWFSEMKEIITRPRIHRVWKWVERTFVPRFPIGYTVSYSIARSFLERYYVSYAVVMNATVYQAEPASQKEEGRFLLYQGAVNEGRCLEWLIPAMKNVEMPLVICGDGNFMLQCRQLISAHKLEDRVQLRGNLSPEELKQVTRRAYAGINLVEPFGENQVMSLANKFFDYFHAGIPQLTMNFPEYRRINNEFEVALLIDRPEPYLITEALNNLVHNKVLYRLLQSNCDPAARRYNWQSEESKLLKVYTDFFKEN